MRWLMGVREYAPRPRAFPPALVRRPTWYGARGRSNGRAPSWHERYTDPAIDHLVSQHRLIRQMIADVDRVRAQWTRPTQEGR